MILLPLVAQVVAVLEVAVVRMLDLLVQLILEAAVVEDRRLVRVVLEDRV
jgi:hypothetical protein